MRFFEGFEDYSTNPITSAKAIEKLQEIVPQVTTKNRVLVLIFTHGEDDMKADERKSMILVGKDAREKLGRMYAAELNSILSPCLARMILIT